MLFECPLVLQPGPSIAGIRCGVAPLLMAYAYVYDHCGAIIVRLSHGVCALRYQLIVRGPNEPHTKGITRAWTRECFADLL
jgi:hypothetical protein